MNEFDILKELEKLNDDSEPGFLSELQQQAPDELHSRVMNSIRAEMKPRRRFNYSKYASFATAAALIIFTFINSGPNGLLDSNNLVNTKNLTEFNQMENPLVNKDAGTDAKKYIINGKAEVNDTKAVEDYPKVLKKARSKQNSKVAYSSDKSSKTSTTVKHDVPKTSKTAIANILPKTEPKKLVDVSKEVAIESVNRKSPVNTNLDLKNIQDPSDLVDKSNQTNEMTASSKVATTASLVPDNLVTGFRVASLSLDSIVNYEISLNMAQTYIIQFIKEKGVKLSEELYKLDKEDFDMLDQILDQSGIAKNKVNVLDNQYVIIKMIMY